MTGNNDYTGKKWCRYASMCGCVCDDNVPVTECPNYWRLDDLYSDLRPRNDDDFYNDGYFENEEDEW